MFMLGIFLECLSWVRLKVIFVPKISIVFRHWSVGFNSVGSLCEFFFNYFLFDFIRQKGLKSFKMFWANQNYFPRPFIIRVKTFNMKKFRKLRILFESLKNIFFLFSVCTITLVLTFYAFICSINCFYQFFGVAN